MSTARVLAAALLLLPTALPGQQRRPMTAEDVVALKTVGNPEISPDGKWIAYTVSHADLKANERRTRSG